MPRKPTPESVFASARQAYLTGGGTLSQVAKECGVARSVLADRAAKEGWAAERAKIENRLKPDSHVAAVARAADARAAAVDRHWRERIEGILNRVGNLLDRESEALERADTKEATWQERATLLKMLGDTLAKIHALLPNVGETGGGIEQADVEKARERLLKRLTREDDNNVASDAALQQGRD